eukprot:3461583-Prymnesium_polylepis.2
MGDRAACGGGLARSLGAPWPPRPHLPSQSRSPVRPPGRHRPGRSRPSPLPTRPFRRLHTSCSARRRSLPRHAAAGRSRAADRSAWAPARTEDGHAAIGRQTQR